MLKDRDLADLAMAAYQPREKVEALGDVRIYRGANARAIAIQREALMVVAFAGTDDLNDLGQNARGYLTPFSTGRVHAGFLQHTMQVWGRLKARIKESDLPIVLVGHSLGGACASIAAVDCARSGLEVKRLVTFGAPRVGDKKFAAELREFGFPQPRYVNCADVVTRIPRISLMPFGMYRHAGDMVYLSCSGKRLVNPSRLSIFVDRSLGRLIGVLNSVFRGVSDHSIGTYARRA